MQNFPEIVTERCHLRRITGSDQQQVFEGLSHPEVIKFYGVNFSTFEETGEQMTWYDQSIADNTGIWWAICKLNSPKMVGACGFNNLDARNRKAEMGYWLMPDVWGEGLVSEVLPFIIRYAFSTLNLHRIEATVEADNLRSKKVMQALDFLHEGTLHECEYKNGMYIDLEYYALLNAANP